MLACNSSIMPAFFLPPSSSCSPSKPPQQVLLTPSKEYNPQSSATWRALQEEEAPVDPEKVANYTSMKEHDPIYSEVYSHPVAPKPGQRPPPRTNNGGPRSPVSDLLPAHLRPAGAANGDATDAAAAAAASPPRDSAVLKATLADSKPINHQMTQEPVKIPMFEDGSGTVEFATPDPEQIELVEEYREPRIPGRRRPKTNAIGGRKKIAQTASFNRLMMNVLGDE